MAELDGAGNVVSYFVYGSEEHVPDYMLRFESGAWAKYRFIFDLVGSVRYVVRESDSAIAQEITYSPFGEILSDTAPGFQPFSFAGGLYDELTGLVRFGARDYDAETGRWQSRDPILFGSGALNLYSYVDNDPVNWIDILGESKHGGKGSKPKTYRSDDPLFKKLKKFWDSLMGDDERKRKFDAKAEDEINDLKQKKSNAERIRNLKRWKKIIPRNYPSVLIIPKQLMDFFFQREREQEHPEENPQCY